MNDGFVFIRHKERLYVRTAGEEQFRLMRQFPSVESAKRYANRLEQVGPGSVKRYEWLERNVARDALLRMIDIT